MKKSATLLACFVFVFFTAYCQYLAPAFQNKTVSMKLVHSGLYVRNSATQPYQDYEQPDFYQQEWILENVPGKPNWYWIKQAGTNNYIRVNIPVEGQNLLMDDTQPDMPAEIWEFQFVAQPEYGRYKIHTRYNQGGVALVLEADPSVSTPALLRLGRNQSTGNEQHQKFDLTDLYPPSDPGSATASLANRFEGRTVGMKNRYFDKELRGNGGTEDIKIQAGYVDFAREFRLEYTNETGWYKIRHKGSGKYVTILSALDGGVVKLKFDSEYDDDQQKFKFVVQTVNDYTYKIHSKYSEGTPGFKKALVLEMNAYNELAAMRLKKNVTAGQDQWQQFELYRYMPGAAEFTKGVQTNGAGKILGKQYYLSNYESLALLEPYIVGADTFVRVQSNPVYGEQSEWTFDDGVDSAGFKHFRLRYGKTGQYLYLPVATQNTFPQVGTKLKMVTDTGSNIDLRFHFRFDRDNNADHTFSLVSGIAPNMGADNRDVIIDDDGNLVTDKNTSRPYVKNRRFFVNLSLPTGGDLLYSIVSKEKGHPLSDSGKKVEGAVLVHARGADLSSVWHFLLTNDGYYRIKNAITGNFIVGTSGVGAQVKTSLVDVTSDAWKWEVVRSGNYYKLKNKSSGYFLSIYNHPNPGNPLYNALSSDAGTSWAISRSDYVRDLLIDEHASQTLLANYAPATINVLSHDSVKNKLIKNIGLPFEPSYAYLLMTDFARREKEKETGIPYFNPPNFFEVVRSALAWKFGWSATQVDSALRNYKFNIPGHRVQVVFALRSYVLERLAALNDRTTQWTYNERQLVSYIERAIKKLKENYATRLKDSWDQYKHATQSNAELYFEAILIWIPDPDHYREPLYYIADGPESISLAEYSAISRGRNYKNPGNLATLIVPSATLVGATALASALFNVTNIAQVAADFKDKVSVFIEAARKLSEKLPNQVHQAAIRSTTALNMVRSVGSIAGAAGIIFSIVDLIQTITQVVQDGLAYEDFNDAMNSRIEGLRTKNINVNTIMGGQNVLDKVYLCVDIDYVLGTGERFDEIGTSSHRVVTFNGNGNWSDPGNWENGQMPTFIHSVGVSLPDSVVINPIHGGECVLDVDVDAVEPSVPGQISVAAPTVPIVVQRGKTLRIKPGKNLRVGDLRINR